MKLIEKIDSFFLGCNKSKLVLLPLFLCISISLLSALCFVIFFDESNSTIYQDKLTIRLFITSVIIAPPLETLIFQHIPYFFFKKIISNFHITSLIIGVLFGFIHYFNEQNFFEVFTISLIGIIYAYIYIIAYKRDNTYPFLITALIHCMYNFFVFLLKFLNQ
tara:strand:+ start:1935 stop:2423 length:489 start_codon:yes stop_codon:yes gene_type:complete